MRKERTVGTLAIPVEVLSGYRRDRHGDTDKAVVVNTDPNNIEPSQAAPGSPPGASLTAATLCEPVERPDPTLDRMHIPEVFLLLVEVGRNVMAQEREKGGYSKGLVAVADNLEVDGVPVEAYRKEGRGRINRHHEEDADDTARRALAGLRNSMEVRLC